MRYKSAFDGSTLISKTHDGTPMGSSAKLKQELQKTTIRVSADKKHSPPNILAQNYFKVTPKMKQPVFFSKPGHAKTKSTSTEMTLATSAA